MLEHDAKTVAGWVFVSLVFGLPILLSIWRRRKIVIKAPPLPEDDVRPAHIPMIYSWDDWIRDIYSAGVSTDLIMEKIRWCGMPKRPAPATTTATIPMTITVEGVSSGTGVGGVYTPIPTWVGGMVIPSTTLDPNPPVYNVSGHNGSYYNAMTNVYPYGSSYYNMNQSAYNYRTSSAFCTNPSVVNVTSSNMASFTHATFNG